MEGIVNLHLWWQLQTIGIGVDSLSHGKGPDSLVIQLLRFSLGFDMPCRKPHLLANCELYGLAFCVLSLPLLSFPDMPLQLLVNLVQSIDERVGLLLGSDFSPHGTTLRWLLELQLRVVFIVSIEWGYPC